LVAYLQKFRPIAWGFNPMRMGKFISKTSSF
jgi:hypothetical protein